MDAVEREFPGVSTEEVTDLQSAFVNFSDPVSLILVDAALLADLDAVTSKLLRQHPTAAIALMFDDCWHEPDMLADILFSKTIRGVLPMNLKLDIWLSVVRLMLRGGEYFPTWLVQARHRNLSEQAVKPTTRAGANPPLERSAGSADLSGLTERELQILEMVSRGYQNKVIAAKINLSEHTVKVHLHHIIKKLGADNRTSAAAIFLGRT